MSTNCNVGELRKTGISVIGDVPWGAHLCHFYETKEDLLDILIPYFRAGLENNEFCVWVVSDPLGEEDARNALRQVVPEADRYLEAGRMEIVPHPRFLSSRQQTSSADHIEVIPHTDWYLKGGAFIAERVLSGWNQKLAGARAKGYAGLRANGNEAWLTAENWKAFSEYEKTLDENLAGQRMIVLCSYPLAGSSAAQIFDVVDTHELAIVRREGEWKIVETPELKRAKSEIERLNLGLEKKVERRTRELATTNEALRAEIAERKRAEEAMRDSQQLVRLVLETLPVGVSVTNRAGDIVLVNGASKLIWGGTIVGGRERWEQTKGYWHDSGQRIAPQSWASARALSKGETSLNELIDIETYDGKRKTIQNSVAPLRNEEGLIVGAVMVNEDVTDRNQAEKKVREANDQLRFLSRRLLHVQEEERRHLARELHDEIGQTLTVAKLNLKIIAPDMPRALTSRLDDSIHLLDRLLAQVRQLSLDLRPPLLDQLGLMPALRWLVDQQRQRARLRMSFSADVDGLELDPAIQTACFRVAQEAITNVIRHAGAKNVAVDLRCEADRLWLSVRDDGAGFDPGAIERRTAARSNLGLVSMKERALLVRGGLEVRSVPEKGTEIRAWFPLISQEAGSTTEVA
jgi:PAS domain S-box-containing protein